MNNLPNLDFSKIGRNDLCPCGSGKKYKKCHLEQKPMSESKHPYYFRKSSPANTVTFDPGELGYPGAHGELIAVPQFSGSAKDPRKIDADFEVRTFKVWGYFSKGDSDRKDSHFKMEFDPELGSS